MMNTNRALTVADELALNTADAYSFRCYGAKNWLACCQMLLARGYNAIEVECIMRSVFTRYATDNIATRRRATAADLADLLDNRSGGTGTLRDYVDETVLAQMHQEPEKLNSRDALRLAYSRE